MMAPMGLPQGMPSPADMGAMAMPDMGLPGMGGGMPMPGLGGLPSLALDMGPSMPIATIGNTETGGQNTQTGNGEFVFKGLGGQGGAVAGSLLGFLPIFLIGGIGYILIRRFT